MAFLINFFNIFVENLYQINIVIVCFSQRLRVFSFSYLKYRIHWDSCSFNSEYTNYRSSARFIIHFRPDDFSSLHSIVVTSLTGSRGAARCTTRNLNDNEIAHGWTHSPTHPIGRGGGAREGWRPCRRWHSPNTGASHVPSGGRAARRSKGLVGSVVAGRSSTQCLDQGVETGLLAQSWSSFSVILLLKNLVRTENPAKLTTTYPRNPLNQLYPLLPPQEPLSGNCFLRTSNYSHGNDCLHTNITSHPLTRTHCDYYERRASSCRCIRTTQADLTARQPSTGRTAGCRQHRHFWQTTTNWSGGIYRDVECGVSDTRGESRSGKISPRYGGYTYYTALLGMIRRFPHWNVTFMYVFLGTDNFYQHLIFPDFFLSTYKKLRRVVHLFFPERMIWATFADTTWQRGDNIAIANVFNDCFRFRNTNSVGSHKRNIKLIINDVASFRQFAQRVSLHDANHSNSSTYH